MSKVKEFLKVHELDILSEAYTYRANYEFMKGIKTVKDYNVYMDSELLLLEYFSKATDFASVTDFIDFVERVHTDMRLVAKVSSLKEDTYAISFVDGFIAICDVEKDSIFIYQDMNY